MRWRLIGLSVVVVAGSAGLVIGSAGGFGTEPAQPPTLGPAPTVVLQENPYAPAHTEHRQLLAGSAVLDCVAVLSALEGFTSPGVSKAHGAVEAFDGRSRQGYRGDEMPGPVVLYWVDGERVVASRRMSVSSALVVPVPPATEGVELPVSLAVGGVPASLALGRSCAQH